MTQEIEGRYAQKAFVFIYKETIILEQGKHSPEVFKMFFVGGARNEDIVKINKDERHRTENRVHESLEGLGAVFEPKRHSQELKRPKRSDDRRLRDMCLIHWNLMVGFGQVDL